MGTLEKHKSGSSGFIRPHQLVLRYWLNLDAPIGYQVLLISKSVSTAKTITTKQTYLQNNSGVLARFRAR